MKGKIAFIAGGSGGIGIEAAKELCSKGMKCCISFHTDREKTRKRLQEHGIKGAELYKMDVSSQDSVSLGINDIIGKHKRIDVVVYSISAPLEYKRLKDLSWKDFQKHIDTQAKGFFLITKALSDIIAKSGNIKFIVLLTEAVIGKPPSMLSHYVTAKYCLMGLVKSLASELGKNGCTFNMVSPGMVNTGLLKNAPQKIVEISAYTNPMKKIAEPQDVARIISFLASEDSNYLNGVNILVDGGNIFL